MHASRWVRMVAVTLTAGAMVVGGVGCKSNKHGGSDNQSLDSFRESLRATNPNAYVGQVVAALPDGKYVMVGDIPVEQFREGEMISFTDKDKKPISHGIVRSITPDSLHVEINQIEQGGRAPKIGDIAYRFKL